MLTGLMLKRVAAPNYLVQIIAVLLLFGGASVMLWRLSNTAYSETIVTFLAFFFWQVLTTLIIRFAKNSDAQESSETDATRILISRSVHRIATMKQRGTFVQVMVFCAGFAAIYVVMRGLLLTLFNVVFNDVWMAAAAGALAGALLIAPWLLADLREKVDEKLVGKPADDFGKSETGVADS